MTSKKNIMLKISGACLKSDDKLFDKNKVQDLIAQIKEIKKQYNIAIIIGGGNIFRGVYAKDFNLNRNDADNMGMLSTLINATLLESILNDHKIKAKTFNAIHTPSICTFYTPSVVTDALNEGYVCILAGGTGNSHFSTDTGVALRAAQLKIDCIYMGKNGTDGVYDSDPNKNTNAKRFTHLTYEQIIKMNLQVMDLTALTMCSENNIKLVVFNIDKPQAIVKAINQKCLTTIISK